MILYDYRSYVPFPYGLFRIVVWPSFSASERHLLFPKARTPTTSRFIYTTQDSEGQSVSERTHEHNHMKRTLRSNTGLRYDHMTQNIGLII